LSQIALWVITIVLGLVVGARYIEALQGVTVPWSLLLVVVLFFLPAYALVAGLMTAIGGVVTQVQQGQQIAGILNLLFLLPLFLIVLFLNNPNRPTVVALTLFPHDILYDRHDALGPDRHPDLAAGAELVNFGGNGRFKRMGCLPHLPDRDAALRSAAQTASRAIGAAS
jgi:hypothetical protein